jgi:hypothetical protein
MIRTPTQKTEKDIHVCDRMRHEGDVKVGKCRPGVEREKSQMQPKQAKACDFGPSTCTILTVCHSNQFSTYKER